MIPRIPVHDEDDDNSGGPTPFWRRPRVILVAGIAGVVLVSVFVRGNDRARHVGNQKPADSYIGEVVGYQPPARLIQPAQAQEPPTTPPGPSASPIPPPAPITRPPPDLPPSAPPERPALPAAPSFRSMMPQQMAQQSVSNHTRMLVYAVPPIQKPAPPAPDPETGLDFKASSIPGMKASPAIDDTYQLMPGLLPLVLDTAINSDVPGPILAHLPGPIYSPKGVLLMEAGTQVIGRYETMGKGSRLMASSLYAHTPNGVWVPLTGQGMADDLGRSGLDGEVNQHLIQRFGAAVLLTLTDQGLQIIQAEASKGGNTYLSLNSGGGVSSVASQILQSQINIPPTFTKHQGETMALFLDAPIDFSASYRVHAVKEQP